MWINGKPMIMNGIRLCVSQMKTVGANLVFALVAYPGFMHPFVAPGTTSEPIP